MEDSGIDSDSKTNSCNGGDRPQQNEPASLKKFDDCEADMNEAVDAKDRAQDAPPEEQQKTPQEQAASKSRALQLHRRLEKHIQQSKKIRQQTRNACIDTQPKKTLLPRSRLPVPNKGQGSVAQPSGDTEPLVTWKSDRCPSVDWKSAGSGIWIFLWSRSGFRFSTLHTARFGSQNERRIIKWMLEHAKKTDFVLDVGCGNGHLLIQLAKEGFANLTGVDYVEGAVTLAIELATKEAVSVVFEVGDILEEEPSSPFFSRKYDFVLDKGTYDAISLCPDDPATKRKRYLQVATRLLSAEGHLVIVSCNWTRQELTEHFKPELTLLDSIPTPTFSFGGSQGSSVTSLVFRRKSTVEGS